jgi:hypothetical protein
LNRRRLPAILAPEMNPRLLAASALVFSVSAFATSIDAWLPEQRQLVVTPGYSYANFDSIWAPTTKISLPADHTTHVGYALLEYGILANLAADLTLGYGHVDLDPVGSDDGLIDTSLGLRYRIVDEHTMGSSAWPTITVRAGGTIAGSYAEDFPFGLGDGANGFDATLLLAKDFGQSGFGIYGDVGYRYRDRDVPDDFAARFGLRQRIKFVTLMLDYRHIESLDGIDILGPQWNPGAGPGTGYPALKEVNQILGGTIQLSDRGGRLFQFHIAHNLDGRNTGDKLLLGFSVRLPFHLGRE